MGLWGNLVSFADGVRAIGVQIVAAPGLFIKKFGQPRVVLDCFRRNLLQRVLGHRRGPWFLVLTINWFELIINYL